MALIDDLQLAINKFNSAKAISDASYSTAIGWLGAIQECTSQASWDNPRANYPKAGLFPYPNSSNCGSRATHESRIVQFEAAKALYNTHKAITDSAQVTVSNIEAQIAAQQDIEQQELLADPNFILSQQQLVEEEKTKRNRLILFGVIGVVLIISTIIIVRIINR